MGTLEKQRESIERKIAVVNLLKSVVKFADDKLSDPRKHTGVAKEVQDMVQHVLGGMIERIEGSGVSGDATIVKADALITNMTMDNDAKAPNPNLGEKRKKSEFAKRHSHLANKVFDLQTKTGTAKARVVRLEEPNVVVQVEGTKHLLKVPVELVELSGGQQNG